MRELTNTPHDQRKSKIFIFDDIENRFFILLRGAVFGLLIFIVFYLTVNLLDDRQHFGIF
jgi:hypothetical protein